MKIQSVLRKVPLLLNSSEPEQAIKILSEAIQKDPENPHLYTSLGRVYQRLNSPQEAVPYFKRSIELFKLMEAKSKQSETLSANDLEYLDDQSNALKEQEFIFPELSVISDEFTGPVKRLESLGSEQRTQPPHVTLRNNNTEVNQESSSRPTLGLKENVNENKAEEIQECETEELEPVIIIKKSRAIFCTKSQFELGLSSNNKSTQKYEEKEKLQNSHKFEGFSDHVVIGNTSGLQHQEVTLSNIDGYADLDDDEDEFLDVKLDEEDYQEIEGFSVEDEYSEDITKSIDQEWAELEAPIKYELSEEDLYDDFNPEFIENFEELLSSEEDDEPVEDGVSLWQKAERVAAEFLLHANWSIEHLDFMTNIFCTKGYGPTKRALHFLLERGLTFDELYLAYCIRSYWKQNENYWTSFNGIGAFHAFTSPLYKHMSWRQALSIVRLFSNIPQPEEIELYLEEEFSYWFNHLTLRRTHPVFIKYLAYKKSNGLELGMVNYGDKELDGYITYDPLLNEHWSSPQSDEVQELRELGVNLF